MKLRLILSSVSAFLLIQVSTSYPQNNMAGSVLDQMGAIRYTPTTNQNAGQELNYGQINFDFARLQMMQQISQMRPANVPMVINTSNKIKNEINPISANRAPTSQEIETAWQNQIYRKYFSNTSNENPQQKRLSELLKEAILDESNNASPSDYYKSPKFVAKIKAFENALRSLQSMLVGNTPLSLKDAFYNVENAYGDTYLSYKEYSNEINESVKYIKIWLQQNGYDINDNEALNLGIQKFNNDTLEITIVNPDSKETTKIKHYPFGYDYVDFKAEEDHRNYFVTKSLATGMGQCNNLHQQYLLFAEGLGAKSYLSQLPNHGFVMYPDNKGNIQNYEATNGLHFTDKEYQDYFNISPRALRSKIYMDTLNKKMIVADCVIDLAYAFMRKNGVADGEFIKKCIATAAHFYPKDRENVRIHFMGSSLLARQMLKQMTKDGIKDMSEISKSPEASKLYQQLLQNEQYISSLGYEEMPKDYYELLMEKMDIRGKMQKTKNLDGKQKRNLFVKSN